MKNFIFQSFPMRKDKEKNNIMIRLEKKEEQREVENMVRVIFLKK